MTFGAFVVLDLLVFAAFCIYAFTQIVDMIGYEWSEVAPFMESFLRRAQSSFPDLW